MKGEIKIKISPSIKTSEQILDLNPASAINKIKPK